MIQPPPPIESYFKLPIDYCLNTFIASLPAFESLSNIIESINIEGNDDETISINFKPLNPQGIMNFLPLDLERKNVKIESNQVTFNILGILNTKFNETSEYLFHLWESFKIDKIKFIFPQFENQTVNLDLEANPIDQENFLIKTFIKNINSLKFQFITIDNGVEKPVKKIQYVYRIIAICDIDLFNILIFALDKDPKFQITQPDIELNQFNWNWDDDQKKMFSQIIYNEGLRVEQLPSPNNINKPVYVDNDQYPGFYNLINLNDLNDFETRFVEFYDPNNHEKSVALVYKKDLSIFLLTIYEESKYTFDLIHVRGDKSVEDFVKSSDCQGYKGIINGPFFYTERYLNKVNLINNPLGFDLAPNGKCKQIGFRKFKGTTYDGMPKKLSFSNENSKLWFTRIFNENPNEFPAKLFIDNNNFLSIQRGLLNENELSNSLCAFDKLVFSYAKNLTEIEQPCNSSNPLFNVFKETGTGNPDQNIGRPFIGLVERDSKKYIFTMTLKGNSKFKNENDDWNEIFNVFKQLNPVIAVYTDGSDSIFLAYSNNRSGNEFIRDTSFGFGKNRYMPCLIGIKEK